MRKVEIPAALQLALLRRRHHAGAVSNELNAKLPPLQSPQRDFGIIFFYAFLFFFLVGLVYIYSHKLVFFIRLALCLRISTRLLRFENKPKDDRRSAHHQRKSYI